jgi:hypothetical protein
MASVLVMSGRLTVPSMLIVHDVLVLIMFAELRVLA